MKTVWIIEDHAAFRRTLVRVLNAEADLQCSRDFDCCEKALAAMSGGDLPDLILLDVGLPGMSGIEGIRLLKERAPKTLIVILTVFEDDDKVFKAICSGAAGYLLKTSSAIDIIAAVRDALSGGSPMNPRVARRVLDMFSRLAPKQSDYGLSEREKEILQLMTSGLITNEIYDQL
jgi:DNA-binding NarL/FixJ family response regulator